MINGLTLDDADGAAVRSLATNNGDGFNALAESAAPVLGAYAATMDALLVYADESTLESTVAVPPPTTLTHLGVNFLWTSTALDPVPVATYAEVEA